MEPKRRKLSHARLESVLPDELIENIPLVDVYSVMITNPRNISKVIIEINEKLPVVDLQHLKRMKAKEMLLFPVSWLDHPPYTDTTPQTNEATQITLPTISRRVLEFITSKNVTTEYFDPETIKSTSVGSIPPKTKRQYTIINKLWPCNFHSNKYIENLVENTLFNTKELELHTTFLKLAQEIKKLTNLKNNLPNLNTCGVLVTDPLRNDLIIAGGYSLTDKNPIFHAVVVAIDGVARSQNGGAYDELSENNIDWDSVLQKFNGLQVLKRSLVDNKDEGINDMQINNVLDENEYLCTNYNVYMTHEPCIMCAMALIHSRAKRIFYIFPSQNGGTGTRCKIHAVKDLNHHYEVFKVMNDDLDYFLL